MVTAECHGESFYCSFSRIIAAIIRVHDPSSLGFLATSNQEVVGYYHNICTTVVPVYVTGRPFSAVGCRVCGWVKWIVVSPLVVFRVPSRFMNASQ